MTKDFDLKFGYKNRSFADSEALFMCPCLLDASFLNSKLASEKFKKNLSIFIPLTFDHDIFLNTSIWEVSHETILFWGV